MRNFLSWTMAFMLLAGSLPATSWAIELGAEETPQETAAIEATQDEEEVEEGPGLSEESEEPEGPEESNSADATESPDLSETADEPEENPSEEAVLFEEELELERTAAVGFSQVYAETAGRLLAVDPQSIKIGSTGGEWLVLGLARSNAQVPNGFFDPYLANVAQTLINKNGVLHSVKYTEYSRVILGLTSLGASVVDVGGYNLLEYLTDMDNIEWQGINGPIWALIALDSGNYEIPLAPAGARQTTRDGLIAYILDKQLADGGWALSGSGADPDMTAMAIQALAPYYNKRAEVTVAVNAGIQRLSALQRSNGGYASWGTVNAESCAQVVVALCALGIDPAQDERFVKEGSSVLDGLLEFAVAGGGFSHTASAVYNQMATEQGFYALAAYDRFKAGKTPLYVMTDELQKPEEELPSLPPVVSQPTVDVESGSSAGPTEAAVSPEQSPSGVARVPEGSTRVLDPAMLADELRRPPGALASLDKVAESVATGRLPDDDLALAFTGVQEEDPEPGWPWASLMGAGAVVFVGAAWGMRKERIKR